MHTARLAPDISHDLPDNSLRACTWAHLHAHNNRELRWQEKKESDKGPCDESLRHSNLVTQQPPPLAAKPN